MDTEVRSHSLTLSHSPSLSSLSLYLLKGVPAGQLREMKMGQGRGLDVSSAEAPWAESSNSLVYALYNALYALVCRC